jgi:hypothetical protein
MYIINSLLLMAINTVVNAKFNFKLIPLPSKPKFFTNP